ncbi:MAG: OmpA family protein [Candidatus Electryonea clarkiae]|nr:OmpA family protein [Candidatus Electryonea clarkiae]MDP8289299.1 OmpA family protein [Candidatus Electryonea clarkiae]
MRTIVTVFVVGFCLTVASVFAASINDQLAEMQDEFEELVANEGELLSPRNFNEAEKHLNKARDEFQKGKDIASIGTRLKKAKDAIDAANKVIDTAHQIFETSLEARNACYDVNAMKYAPKEYVKAEDTFKSAIGALEADKLKAAGQKARESEAFYRDAELIAIKVDVLGKARSAIKEAEESDADKYASTSMQLSRDLLDEATSVLDVDRSGKGLKKATVRARKSAYEARHAMYITRRAQSLEKDKTGLEVFVLESEDYLKKLTAALEYKAVYDEGFSRPLDEMAAIVSSIRKNLGADIVRLNTALAEQTNKADSLCTALSKLKKKYKKKVGKLKSELEELIAASSQADSIRAAKEAEAQALENLIQFAYDSFNDTEAAVLMQDNDLVIRVIGLKFDVGAATLQPASFGLLGKLQKVLHEFLDYEVTIEGHTDSQGSDKINLELSKSRADAVLQYLLSTSDKLNAGMIQSTGFGEAKPIASNETKDGRAQNRRIEITINDVK